MPASSSMTHLNTARNSQTKKPSVTFSAALRNLLSLFPTSPQSSLTLRAPSLAHAGQLDPLDVEGILALRSISERCADRIGDAARILETQNEVLYAEE